VRAADGHAHGDLPCALGDVLAWWDEDSVAAARELATTSKPLSLVALDAGFYDQSHFSNVFRRQLAMTPGEYRRVHAATRSARHLH
jgi:transcriptional regulator GlxA family with amidase domain